MAYDPFRTFRRVEAVRFDGATRDQARFVTDAGPLCVESYMEGVLRIRLGDTAGTDYGLLASPPRPAAITCAPSDGGHRIEAGALAMEILERPLRFRLLREHRVLLESAGDGHIRGGLRIPAFAVRDATDPSASLVTFGLESGEAVYGLGESTER